MLRSCTCAAALVLAAFAPWAAAQMPEITVIGTADKKDTTDITPGISARPAADSMEFITRMPGAIVNRNGPLSGQAQYRGLYGPTMTVLVDGKRFTPGGLNWMDSPMHYMPPGLTTNLTMTRGIASVSSGPGIGGLIEAESVASEFTSDHEFDTMGDFVGSVMSNDGYSLSGMLGFGNVNHRLHLTGALDDGDDTEFGNRTIGGTDSTRITRTICRASIGSRHPMCNSEIVCRGPG